MCPEDCHRIESNPPRGIFKESSVRLLQASATMGLAVDVVKHTCRSSGDDEMWHGMNQSLAIAASDHDEGSLQAARGFMTAFDMPKLNTFGQAFRNYDAESERQAGVEAFYRQNHIHQSFSFVQQMRSKHLQLNKTVMSIWDCCELLNQFVDESDPDLDEPQIEHLLQTAEAIRKDHPDEDWFHLTGLIHDLGKVLLHPTFGAEPQYSVVGDTFPVGCAFDPAIVHAEYFRDNPDSQNVLYNSKLGIYKEGCGLDNVMMSWGHDEYMYQVMKSNNTTLPPQALFIVRYHSFYSLHRSGAYSHLLNDSDHQMLPWLKEFNKYDLYSKSKVRADVEKLKPYYLSLIHKYFPNELHW